jgi:hypothetical protein
VIARGPPSDRLAKPPGFGGLPGNAEPKGLTLSVRHYHGEADRRRTVEDYESRGQEFESLRARHLVLACEHHDWAFWLARTAFSSNSLLLLIRI